MASKWGEDVVTLSVSVNLGTKSNKKSVVKNAITKFQKNYTWFDVFEIVTNDVGAEIPENIDQNFEKFAQVKVSNKQSGETETFSASAYDRLCVLTDFDPTLKYVTIDVQSPEENTSLEASPPVLPSAFDRLMPTTQQKKKPPIIPVDKPRFTAKDRLYNDVCAHMSDVAVRFPFSMADETIRKHVDIITNALWYIDGNKDKLNERSKKDTHLPKRFEENFNDYNDWRKKKHKRPQLQSSELKQRAGALFRLVSMAFTQQWGDFRLDLEALASLMDSYAQFLVHSSEQQAKRQKMDHPPRQIGVNTEYEHRQETGQVHPRYIILDNILSQKAYYQYIIFNESHVPSGAFKDFNERHYFIQNIKLSVPIDVLSYSPGGWHTNVVLLWRTPEDNSEDELLKTYEKVKCLLPEFHTRQMKAEFQGKYRNLAKISPAIMRNIYAELTLDATADQNPAVDERIRQAIMSEDLDLVTDMRQLNKGRPNDKFKCFFEKFQEKVENITAADERRHNVEHLSNFVSVKDLIKQVSSDLDEDIPIPSESTVLFSFVPKNAHKNTAKLYKSTVPLQFKVQTRQLRSNHQDDHYCAAVFKYMRQFAIKFREECSLLCVDDKAKVDFGEPGSAISTGVRGKKSIVPMSSILGALDHDLQSKGSLIPSVALQVDVPATIEQSFYRGTVTVKYKDSVFQPSTPFRHAVELEQMLTANNNEVSPVLLIFSDGGPDHRITYHSVKLALIILFKRLNLDMLIAGRTAPGHSWLNPAERIMSVLNIALQNVALMRELCQPAEIETTLKSANTMSEIRKKAERVTGVKESWLRSVAPIIELLEGRTERLALKDRKFHCQPAASEEEVKNFEEQFTLIDESIILGNYQDKHMKSKADYQLFLTNHCRQRQYLFQITKCKDETCCQQRRSPTQFPFVPDPQLKPNDNQHYDLFENLLGTPTTEKDRPSANNTRASAVAENMQGIRNAGLVGQNVRATVNCFECGKPRCIYSLRKLSTRDLRALNRIKEKYDYSCGSVIVPEGDHLEGVVSVRLQMDCSTPIEFPYYAGNNPVAVQKDICCHCGIAGAERDQATLEKYRIVLPVCLECKQTKEIPKRNPIKN